MKTARNGLRLGPGVSIRHVAGRRLLCSVPEELSGDTAQVLELAAASDGKVCSHDLTRTSRCQWPFVDILDLLRPFKATLGWKNM